MVNKQREMMVQPLLFPFFDIFYSMAYLLLLLIPAKSQKSNDKTEKMNNSIGEG